MMGRICRLVGRPMRMGAEKSVHDADLIGNYQSENQADQSRSQRKFAGKALAIAPHQMKGGSDAHGNDHHSGDGSDPKYEQISDGQARIGNRGEHQERDGRGTSQAVNEADSEWPDVLI